jgi:charged multivesicular body protein 4
MNLFGRKKEAPRAPSAAGTNQTLAGMKRTVETLEKKEALLETKMRQLMEQARACAARKDRRGAMSALQKKKLYERQMDQLQKSRLNLETLSMTIESSATAAEILAAMKAGSEHLRATQASM